MSIKERLKDVVKKKKICFRKSNEKLRKIAAVYVIFPKHEAAFHALLFGRRQEHTFSVCPVIAASFG